MKILMFDLDTLRPDHLGCYGYHRNTSPNIDSIAADSMLFENYHCSDAPCLPSRAALTTGMFGIHNGAVNHGDTTADLRIYGVGRDFKDQTLTNNLFYQFRKAGMHTATVSTFAERHSSYWFNAGFNEIVNCGKCGDEAAEEVLPLALKWLEDNRDRQDWFLHVNMWDPHTPYRAPMGMGNPFADSPLPAWMTPEVFKKHKKHVGPHSLNELGMYWDGSPADYPRQYGRADTLQQWKDVIDNYDTDILYMDAQIGKILNWLKEQGMYDDMAILLTSDHGENMGELGIYSEHGTADEITTRIPMLIKWPGMKTGTDKGLHYSLDLLPTIAELFGNPASPLWDGRSYLKTLQEGTDTGREYLVVSQASHVCQRSVRFDRYIYIRSYHDGFHLFPKEMLFDLEADYYEQHDLAQQRPDLCDRACRHLTDWTHDMMMSARSDRDPMWTVIQEGGPYHAKGNLPHYCRRLVETGRSEGARLLRERHPEEFSS